MSALKSSTPIPRSVHREGPLVLATEADMQRAVRALGRQCPAMKRLVATTGVPRLRDYQRGFEGLARIVVGQQVSAQSAAAIWGRTRAAIDPFEPGRLLGATDAELRAAGLSAGKVKTLRLISSAILSADLDLDALDEAGDDEIIATLTELSGIGPWTANLFLLFSLKRADCWASGDLALQHAVRSALGLPAKPGAAELEAIAERWRPWRGAAAHVLWAWYAHPASRVVGSVAADRRLATDRTGGGQRRKSRNSRA